jgi:hypothetical protein
MRQWRVTCKNRWKLNNKAIPTTENTHSYVAIEDHVE